jgi:uncharacterized DUF497 family protein
MTGLFEWDEAKRERNIRDRKIDFIDILPLFEGEVVEIEDNRFDYGETRIKCFGERNDRVYVVIYTWRGENRRIISARKANAREQRAYYARHA